MSRTITRIIWLKNPVKALLVGREGYANILYVININNLESLVALLLAKSRTDSQSIKISIKHVPPVIHFNTLDRITLYQSETEKQSKPHLVQRADPPVCHCASNGSARRSTFRLFLPISSTYLYITYCTFVKHV